MENLLLVLDELDDVFSMVGMVWRSVASFLVAVALFVATGFVFLKMPVVVEFVAIFLVALGLLEFARQKRNAGRQAALQAVPQE